MRNGKFKDITGKKSFSLTAIEPVGQSKNRLFKWKCLCDCGNYTIIEGAKFRAGKIKSCGCNLTAYNKSQIARDRSSNGNFKGYRGISGKYFSSLKAAAKTRDYEFSISIEDIWNIFEAQKGKCALSNLSIHFEPKSLNRSISTASVDRIDSCKGYTKENIQIVHKDINKMKNSYPQDYFIYVCKKIAENFIEPKNEPRHIS